VDGIAVEGSDTLKKVMDKKRAGDSIALTVYRSGSAEKITVKLGEAPDR
jgi:S1-C subfamily serine protease